MDVSSINSTPVSAVLESPQSPTQQRVERGNEQQNQSAQVQPSQESRPNENERVGSQVDVFV